MDAREPVVGNVMIVGDAASFIEVYVQGAIMYGFRAAKAAAKEMQGGGGFAEYVDYWKTSYEYNKPEFRGDYTEFDRDTPHNLASVTKSITSALLGLAIDKGFIESLPITWG